MAEHADAAGARLRVCGLRKSYRRHGTLLRPGTPVPALDGVDLDLEATTTLALVGASGAGKSTLARCLALVERPDAGEIWFDERPLVARTVARRGPPPIQMLFQDAGRALNPRLRLDEIVAEPLAIAGRPRAERRRRAHELLERVGLSPRLAARRPLELSGGQRQRVAIARALAAEPRLLVVDEALSGLDPSIQAQIVELLREIEVASGLQCLHVSHDLALMAHVATELAIMHAGRIVERGPVETLLARPSHAQTRALVSCLELVERG